MTLGRTGAETGAFVVQILWNEGLKILSVPEQPRLSNDF
jgi:hypothetical protein